MTTFIAIDVETANSDPSSICQIGIAIYMEGKLSKSYGHLVNPQVGYSAKNIGIHGISEEDTHNSIIFSEVFPIIASLLDGFTVVSHTMFDRNALQKACTLHDIPFPKCNWVDSSMIARRAWVDVAKRGFGLENLCSRIGFDYDAHDAEQDAIACGQVVIAALEHTNWSFDRAITESRSRNSNNKWEGKQAAQIGNEHGEHYGKTIVFTGDLPVKRSIVASLAAQKGYTVKDNVSKKVDYLIIGRNYENTGKHKRACALQEQGHSIIIGALMQIFTAEELIDAEETATISKPTRKKSPMEMELESVTESDMKKFHETNASGCVVGIFIIIIIIGVFLT